MKLSETTKSIILNSICLLYVLLFVYTAVSKLLDFENFQVQLGQSPLLSAFAEWVSWAVPIVEILIAIALLVPRYRLVGLFSAFALMVMFTVYIIIILNFSSFIPCSCGGIMEKMSWTQHLVFNIVFVILAAAGILILRWGVSEERRILKPAALANIFFITAFCSSALVVGLFLISENIIHYHNKLVRRFPHTPILKVQDTDLKLNSYFIVGVDSNSVYLGNTTAPLLITVLDTKLHQIQKKLIDLDRKDLPFQAVRILVKPPYFFVVDGTVPCVYRGSTKDWKAQLIKKVGEYFTTVEVIDSLAIAVRTHSSINGESIMGVLNLAKNAKTVLNREVLQKQFDGVFDTDGQLLYSDGLKRIIYLYAYRNQYTVVDDKLKIDFRGNTIDTISRAQLSIKEIKSKNQRKFDKLPLFVNKSSAVYRNLLFVNSAIPGRYEKDNIWKAASIIDVYDVSANSYLFSFCIYDIGGKKVRSFFVYDNKLYALIGTQIIGYNLDERVTSKYVK
jgi:uncharacterized membrane protein YphA (DoxX/SURF4 family)